VCDHHRDGLAVHRDATEIASLRNVNWVLDIPE
jgi:hypothetical protein